MRGGAPSWEFAWHLCYIFLLPNVLTYIGWAPKGAHLSSHNYFPRKANEHSSFATFFHLFLGWAPREPTWASIGSQHKYVPKENHTLQTYLSAVLLQCRSKPNLHSIFSVHTRLCLFTFKSHFEYSLWCYCPATGKGLTVLIRFVIRLIAPAYDRALGGWGWGGYALRSWTYLPDFEPNYETVNKLLYNSPPANGTFNIPAILSTN